MADLGTFTSRAAAFDARTDAATRELIACTDLAGFRAWFAANLGDDVTSDGMYPQAFGNLAERARVLLEQKADLERKLAAAQARVDELEDTTRALADQVNELTTSRG